MGLTRFLKYWLPVVLMMAFIFWMSTATFSAENTALIFEPLLRFLFRGISAQAVGLIHGVIRKGGHVAEYFVLGVLLFRAFRGGSAGRRTWQWVIFSIVVVIFYAASDEFHQSFIPTRTASPVDVAIDSVGGMLAQVAGVLAHRRGLKQDLPE